MPIESTCMPKHNPRQRNSIPRAQTRLRYWVNKPSDHRSLLISGHVSINDMKPSRHPQPTWSLNRLHDTQCIAIYAIQSVDYHHVSDPLNAEVRSALWIKLYARVWYYLLLWMVGNWPRVRSGRPVGPESGRGNVPDWGAGVGRWILWHVLCPGEERPGMSREG